MSGKVEKSLISKRKNGPIILVLIDSEVSNIKSSLKLAKDAFVLGTKADRRKARVAQESAFAKVWLTPQEDAAPPAPVMQNVGMAMFGDVMGFAKTAVSLGVGAPPGLDSAGGLFNTGFLAGSGG